MQVREIAWKIVIILVFFSSYVNSFAFSITDSSCIEKIQIRTVTGTSLSGIVENGDSLRIFFGFYKCNEVLKEDIAVYRYAGSKIPLVKVVKAIPGDTFYTVCSGGKCHIFVNRKMVTNSNSSEYYLTEKESSLIRYYEESFKGVIPSRTLMILGNKNGTIDSGKFGLVGLEDIIGKAEKLRKGREDKARHR